MLDIFSSPRVPTSRNAVKNNLREDKLLSSFQYSFKPKFIFGDNARAASIDGVEQSFRIVLEPHRKITDFLRIANQ